jgi:hypothetical protein
MQSEPMSDPTDPTPRPEAGYAPDALPLRAIAAWVGGLAVVLVLVIVGLWQFFLHTAQQEVHVKELVPVAPDLIRQRGRDAALLGRYEVVDEKRGRYRVPITRAMEALAADPALLRFAGAPASAPAAAAPAPAAAAPAPAAAAPAPAAAAPAPAAAAPAPAAPPPTEAPRR